VNDPAGMERAGQVLLELGAGAALVKGGHLPGTELVDVLVTRHGVQQLRHQRIATTSTHGTGCTLSAAITAGLALGRPLDVAVSDALDYLHRAIAAAPGLGRGHGPVDHSA
jgi:hydroxymethylpyrimidine/phosphomethylpyrimidine kinase